MRLANFCKAKRAMLGVTLRQMADELGLSPSFLSSIERGSKKFPQLLIRDYISALSLSGDEIKSFIRMVSLSNGEVKLNALDEINMLVASIHAANLNKSQVASLKSYLQTIGVDVGCNGHCGKWHD